MFQTSLFEKSAPKEYRPYLGPDASEEEIEEHKLENTRDSLKNYSKKRKRRFSFDLGIKRWKRKYQKRKEDSKKRKYKNKIRRKKAKAQKKQQRVDFIRRFMPQYKKSSVISVEFSQDDAAEEKERSKFKGYFSYVVNSTILFLVAYLLVYMIYQITVLVVASRWNLDSVLFYYELQFNNFSPLWNRMNIIITTFSGPAICLLIGILFMRYLSGRPNLKKSVKLFFLWLGIHGYNFFLGAFASGVSFDKGFGYVAAWMYMNVFWQIFISLIFLFLLGMIGYYAAPKFLDTSYSSTRVKHENKFKFLAYLVFLPWLIGSLVIFLVRVPSNMNYDTGNLITLVMAVTPVLFNRHAKPTKNFKMEKKPNRLNYWMIVVFAAIYTLYRWGLNKGLLVDLNYKFIFNLDITPI